MTGMDWSIVLDVGVGVGVLLVGIAAIWAAGALAKTLGRVNKTLEEVDAQLAGVGKPVADALTHVNGIADTADQTVTRLSGVVTSIEQNIAPAVVNVAATIAGISDTLRRLVTGRASANGSGDGNG